MAKKVPYFQTTDDGYLVLRDTFGDEQGSIDVAEISGIIAIESGGDDSLLVTGTTDGGVVACLCAKYPTPQARNNAMALLHSDLAFLGITLLRKARS